MVLISETVKPSWRAVLGYGSATAPSWYAALRDESDRAFWDARWVRVLTLGTWNG